MRLEYCLIQKMYCSGCNKRLHLLIFYRFIASDLVKDLIDKETDSLNCMSCLLTHWSVLRCIVTHPMPSDHHVIG